VLPPRIADVEVAVLHLYELVSEGLAAATEAFLGEDRAAARDLVARDRQIDSLASDVEELVTRQLIAVPTPAPEDIALRIPQGMSSRLTPAARGLVEEMGRVGVGMWRAAADAYAERDPLAAGRLRLLDDQLDDLHVRLSAELAASLTSTSVAIEMGLIARFLERLGDHAVNVTRRLRDLCPDSRKTAV
jgi:phosphate transport system protein